MTITFCLYTTVNSKKIVHRDRRGVWASERNIDVRPEARPTKDRSHTIAPVFQSHWSDPTLYVLERSNGNKNAIWSLILTSDRILANRNMLYVVYNLQCIIVRNKYLIDNSGNIQAIKRSQQNSKHDVIHDVTITCYTY